MVFLIIDHLDVGTTLLKEQKSESVIRGHLEAAEENYAYAAML